MSDNNPFRSSPDRGSAPPPSGSSPSAGRSGRLSSQGSMDSGDGDNDNNENEPIITEQVIRELTCDARHCKKTNPTVKCGRCQSVYYCSQRCQRDNYLEHKPHCFSLAERERAFIGRGTVDANAYNHTMVDDDDDPLFASSSSSSSSAYAAAAPTSSNNNNNSNKKCPICKKSDMNNPVYLWGCGHKVCWDCLDDYTKNKLWAKKYQDLQANWKKQNASASNENDENRSSSRSKSKKNKDDDDISSMFQDQKCCPECGLLQNDLVSQDVKATTTTAAADPGTDNNVEEKDSGISALVMRRAKALVDNAKHNSILEPEKNMLLQEATAELERLISLPLLPPTNKPMAEKEAKHNIGVDARIMLCEIYLDYSNKSSSYNKAKKVLHQAVRAEVERQVVSNDGDKQMRDKAIESMNQKSSSSNQGTIDNLSMDLCEELLISKAKNNAADFGLYYGKMLYLWGQILEAQGDWERALATYENLHRLHAHLTEDSSTPSTSLSRCKESMSLVLRGTSRCRLKYENDAAGALPPARKAVDTYRVTPGGHAHLAKTLEAQPNKEELLEEACRTVQRAVLYEAPWDEENQRRNQKHVAYFKEEIRQAEIRRLKEQDFMKLWGNVLHSCETEEFKHAPKTWGNIRNRFDIHGVDDEDEEDNAGERGGVVNLREKTEQRLQAAAESALTTEAGELEDPSSSSVEIVDGEEFHDSTQEEATPPAQDDNEEWMDDTIDYEKFSKIRLTKAVLKWYDGADGKFQELFNKKLKNLTSGRRGQTTQKDLKGSKTRIYETYLENKSGHRIMWTTDGSGDDESILIWYVVAHKKVSRHMELIDESANRSARPLTLASDLPEIASEAASAAARKTDSHDTGRILLDPKGDIPLKLYELGTEEIDKLKVKSWHPSLHLTPKEREIVETQGTVCVLGRSGTGKTICVASRIDYDRNRNGNKPNFSQLFIARSQRICEYVSDTVGADADEEAHSRLDYMTYQKLLHECEKELGINRKFDPDLRMDFYRFKRDLERANKDCELDPLVVWTQIRSFIKGSIEAVKTKRPLNREEYMNLGTKQCRLAPEQRELAYSAFEAYEKRVGEYWDDTDRVASIIRALKENHEARDKLIRTKLYVDEVQDYTQAEIAMFFLLCMPRGLFLAGDPAQSVEEGVDFRFEDVRIVADSLFQNEDRKRNIPDKPTMLKINFRSHAGILNLAAGILDQLFAAFPGSAKELPKDEGLFRGPRPAVFGGLTEASLVELVKKQQGVVVLTMDEKKKEELEELFGEDVPVLSIRESKGLEFNMVLLVDFFKDLSADNQQSWKQLLLFDDKQEIKEKTPELETHLKQMYTAVTRCCKRMLFAETGEPSIAFEAFIKWAKIRRNEDQRLVEQQNVARVDQVVLTRDEWNKRGLDFAHFAEDKHDIMESKKFLERAFNQFRQGEITTYRDNALTHLSSIEMRIELQDLATGGGLAESSKDETEFASLVLKLLDAGLLLEASRLCHQLVRVMGEGQSYSRKNLKERLLPRLPDLDF